MSQKSCIRWDDYRIGEIQYEPHWNRMKKNIICSLCCALRSYDKV